VIYVRAYGVRMKQGSRKSVYVVHLKYIIRNSIPNCSKRWKKVDKSRLHQRTSVIRCCSLPALRICRNWSALRSNKNKSILLFSILLDIKCCGSWRSRFKRTEKIILLQTHFLFLCISRIWCMYIGSDSDNSNYPDNW